jgi:hypothetical protein
MSLARADIYLESSADIADITDVADYSLLGLIDELAALAGQAALTQLEARLRERARSYRQDPVGAQAALSTCRATVLGIPDLLSMFDREGWSEGQQARATALLDRLWAGVHIVGAGGV